MNHEEYQQKKQKQRDYHFCDVGKDRIIIEPDEPERFGPMFEGVVLLFVISKSTEKWSVAFSINSSLVFDHVVNSPLISKKPSLEAGNTSPTTDWFALTLEKDWQYISGTQTEQNDTKICSCPLDILMNLGCRCGGV